MTKGDAMEKGQSVRSGSQDLGIKGTANHRWIILAASTVLMAAYYGMELSFGVFLKPLIQEFGWSRTAVSGAMSMAVAVSGLLGILTGRWTDKYGVKTIVAIGAVFGFLGYLFMFWADSLFDLYLFFGVFIGVCISTCWSPLIAAISRYFPDKRVLAIGILTSGLTFGSTLMPPLSAYLVADFGWRTSFLFLAGALLIASAPALFLLRKEPGGEAVDRKDAAALSGENRESSGMEKTSKGGWTVFDAMRTVPFLMIAVLGFVTAEGFFFMATHIVAYATDIGIAATSAALILSSQSIGNIIGKLSIWSITNRIGSRFAMMLIVGLQAVCLLLFMVPCGLWLLCSISAVYGYGLGASMALRMSIIPEFFGTAIVGTLVGIVGIAWGLGGIVGPVLAGYLFDMTHSYYMSFVAGCLFLSLGLLASIFLKPPRIR